MRCEDTANMSYFDSRPWLSSYADGVPADIPPTTQTLTDAVARVAEGLRMRGVGHGG